MSEETKDPQVFSWAWREAHAREGDRLLDAATGRLEAINWEAASALALLAQAHYTAANVRAKAQAVDPYRVGTCPNEYCTLWAGHDGLHSPAMS